MAGNGNGRGAGLLLDAAAAAACPDAVLRAAGAVGLGCDINKSYVQK